ncbi:MAG: DUF4446 family protein [Candidatus Doudnabacteria bacterium]
MNNLELVNLIVAGGSLIAAIFAIVMLLRFRKTAKAFFAGKETATLEEFIIAQGKRINELTKQNDILEEAIVDLRKQQKYSIQKIGMVRYNPFADDGGNLSFSMALLDDHNNGVVITSMHGREANRIYAKPIIKSKSEFTLTKEEEQAIIESKIIN